jgi:hypothetical protein
MFDESLGVVEEEGAAGAGAFVADGVSLVDSSE